jgi:hypothetical protein
MKPISILIVLAMAFLAAAGCSSFSTVNPRAMTVDDIISMSKAGAGTEVIKDQILSTHSRFILSPQDIIRLKSEGVVDDVLRAMIESGDRPEQPVWDYGYSPFDYWFDSYGGYPYYEYGAYPFYSYGGYPYAVYRQPGLIGRFYSYYPLSPWSWYGSYPYRWRYESTVADSTYRSQYPGAGQPLRMDYWFNRPRW